MASHFRRQFTAFCTKNIIIFRQRWLSNLLRALIIPVAYGIFLAYAKNFFSKPGRTGFGTAIPVYPLEEAFDGSKLLVWADSTDGTGFISPKDIMDHITAKFTPAQMSSVKHAKDEAQASAMCLTNFADVSGCTLFVTFEGIPTASSSDTRSWNYTLHGYDAHIDVVKHDGFLEKDILPVQWAIDQAIIKLTTGKDSPTLLQLPYTMLDQDDVEATRNWMYMNLIGTFLAVTFFLAFCGITYQLSGAIAFERASLLTHHMQVMGALDSARMLSWHLCVSVMYIPGWFILAAIWQKMLFMRTNVGLLIVIHLVTGLGLASWSFIICVPFRKSPHSAAVVATGLSIVLALAPLMFKKVETTVPPILSFLFPSMFYVLSLKGISGFEKYEMSPHLFKPDPKYDLHLGPMLIAAIVSIFVWPCVAVVLERLIYSGPRSFVKSSRSSANSTLLPEGIVLGLRNVRKTFNIRSWGRKTGESIAIADLSMDIPSHGIFVLLGSNGAGKTTTLSIIAGLTEATDGTVLFEGNVSRPPRGSLGVVPQKDVLFPELTCLETLRLWSEIKMDNSNHREDLEQLLRDCDLKSKIHCRAAMLSGGQKRKLQLAIGLVSGSKIILVDECTSGVDPLSRRALWRTLTTYRNERTIILTTHFLDEADFLGDNIAVLAPPGKLVASDTPVALKSSLGEGYSVSVTFGPHNDTAALLQRIQKVLPGATVSTINEHQYIYRLKSMDPQIVSQVLKLIESAKSDIGVTSYDITGSTIEDIFLDLITQTEGESNTTDLHSRSMPVDFTLSDGIRPSSWKQAQTIFYKRALILRRSWLLPLLAIFVAIAGAIWPVRFLTGGATTCERVPRMEATQSLFPPRLFFDQSIFASPPTLGAVINSTFPELNTYFSSPEPLNFTANQDALVVAVKENRQNSGIRGGISMDFDKNEFLVAYQDRLDFFGLASNIFYNRAINSTNPLTGSRRITGRWAPPSKLEVETLFSLQWLVAFGAAMSVFPAFFAVYVSSERHSSVQAMQLSNGISNPFGLWLGHFMFDSIFVTLASVVIAIVYSLFAKFQGVGYLWLVLWLYSLSGILLAYVTSSITKSPLGAFGMLAISQFIVFVLYTMGYVLTLFSPTYIDVFRTMNIIHFTIASLAPIVSLIRAGMVSINLFALLCDDDRLVSNTELSSITRYGGPILYLFVWCLVLLFLLAQIDTGRAHLLKRSFTKTFTPRASDSVSSKERIAQLDVIAEEERASSPTASDPLRVLHLTKSFDGNRAVDDVSFTVPPSSMFVLLGPNGAGKTTTLDIIRGHQQPNIGDVFVNNTSMIQDRNKASLSLGVCPQFTAIDAHLTVRQHLQIYGRLKGVDRLSGMLERDIETLMASMGLTIFADRLASKISGGNQRKLALAIALLGNPSVILVDEYSTGIDAKMKRELWVTLKQVAKDKSVILTTHSMEEASCLATKVGIMSKRMLAVGTPEELESRNASYEVHFACRWRLDQLKAEMVMSRIPGARKADDVATRFEVPIVSDSRHGVASVAQLFDILVKEKDFLEFTIGKSSLESAFIRIINEDNAAQEK